PAHAPAAAPAWPGEPGPTMSADADLDSRGRLLRAAVGFALVPPSEPELRLVHRWLDSCRGGPVVPTLVRHPFAAPLDYDLDLRQGEAPCRQTPPSSRRCCSTGPRAPTALV